MKIKIIGLASDKSKDFLIEQFIKNAQSKLEDFKVGKQIDKPDLVLFAITTGGVENKFKSIYKKYKAPFFLLYNEFNNSLPASIEILSFLNKEGIKGELIDINELSKEKIKNLIPFFGEKLGLIGNPSDWLIASKYPNDLFIDRFNLKVEYIPIEEAIEKFKSANEKEAEKLSKDILKGANNVFNIDINELKKAFKFYLALKSIISDRKLNYISVRCFDIIAPLNTTGCIALSRLNDEGIIAGCEGDLPSTLSMAILYKVSKKIPFMANISYINQNNSNIDVVLAHCTIGINATKGYNLRTHFETNKGVGIEGIFEDGPVTLLRIGGEHLDKAVLAVGKKKNIKFSPNRCRTQIKVEFGEELNEYFLKKPLGNHHIVVSGNYYKEVKDFLEQMSIELIKWCFGNYLKHREDF